jgi:hypothetical protein
MVRSCVTVSDRVDAKHHSYGPPDDLPFAGESLPQFRDLNKRHLVHREFFDSNPNSAQFASRPWLPVHDLAAAACCGLTPSSGESCMYWLDGIGNLRANDGRKISFISIQNAGSVYSRASADGYGPLGVVFWGRWRKQSGGRSCRPSPQSPKGILGASSPFDLSYRTH